ncbi:MAG: DNA repair protein RecO [Agathobacter sp.]|nr:DNA repair protein RecO [Agathobacter sp.]
MSESVVLTGMVLTAMPISDYDKRITILTKERGKITAFARGARRPQSQLLAATNPFCFGEFELYEGKSAYNLIKASIHNYFRELTLDVEGVYTGFYFLEFAEYFCQENNDEKEMLKLLYQSLRAVESPAYDNRLVRAVFELKAMTINGEGPQVFSCMNCHKKDVALVSFSVPRGGMLCESCAHVQKGISVCNSTRYALQYVVSSSVEKLFSFKVSNEVAKELCEIATAYISHYVRHTFKSLQIIADGATFLT